MKLRNKKTGEIMELCCHRAGDYREKYDSLAELNAEWEDVPEEPKEYWIPMSDEPYPFVGNDWEEEGLATGLISLSKEENDRKRQKLKAWKRLKDKGFRFDDFVRDAIYFNLDEEQIQNKSILKDLDLLFGGEK